MLLLSLLVLSTIIYFSFVFRLECYFSLLVLSTIILFSSQTLMLLSFTAYYLRPLLQAYRVSSFLTISDEYLFSIPFVVIDVCNYLALFSLD